MNPDNFFPSSYQQSRERALTSARSWSKHIPVTIDSRSLSVCGPAGETLALDWIQFGPRRRSSAPARALVLACGTHGLEGFCGAGVQHALVENWAKQGSGTIAPLNTWPDDFALVILHAVNPYGYAWLRRVNENNVDLNRNSLPAFDPNKIHPDYELLFDAINPSDMDPQAEQARWQRIDAFIAEKGQRAFQQALSEGQYKYPKGLQFGGQAQQASVTHLQALVREHLRESEHVLWVDYHTGLGELGACELITGVAKDSASYATAYAAWGDAVKTTDSDESLSTKLNGLLEQGLRPCLSPQTRFGMVAAEYGTYPVMDVLKAIRTDNWLHHHCSVDQPQWASMKADILEKFRPNQAIWRERVLAAAQVHLGQAFRALGLSAA